MLGLALFMGNDVPNAVRILKKASADFPKEWKAQALLGEYYAGQKQYDLGKINNQIYEGDEVYALIFNKKIPMIMTAWMKLYKRQIFESLRFDEGKLHEDEFIIHKTLHLCGRFIFCELPLYNYLQRNNSQNY